MAHILVVDDSAVDCLLFRTYAERVSGYHVIEAKDGEDALRKIDNWSIELIITDLLMPNMDGLELLGTVRERYPDIPVIIATGRGNEEMAAKALEMGAVGFVPKSQLDKLLVPMIQDALSKSRAETDPRR